MVGEEFSSSGTFKYGFAPRIDNLKEANKGNVVTSGCEVTANATPDMNVDISAGEIIIGGSSVTVSAVDDEAVDAAHATLDRFDTISVGSNGTVDYTAGTAAAKPYPPDLAADHILLAVIFVENNSTTVESADILDTRIINANSFMKKGMYLKETVSGTVTNVPVAWTDEDTVSFSAGELGANDIVVVEARLERTGGTGNLEYRFEADGHPAPNHIMTGTETSFNSVKISGGISTNDWITWLESGGDSGGGNWTTCSKGDTNNANWITQAWDLKLQMRSANADEDGEYLISVYVVRG